MKEPNGERIKALEIEIEDAKEELKELRSQFKDFKNALVGVLWKIASGLIIVLTTAVFGKAQWVEAIKGMLP